jgi:hypothetical protein
MRGTPHGGSSKQKAALAAAPDAMKRPAALSAGQPPKCDDDHRAFHGSLPRLCTGAGQQPRRGLGQEGRPRPCAAGLCRSPSALTLPTAPPPPITRMLRRKSNGWVRFRTRRTCRASIAPPRASGRKGDLRRPRPAQFDRNINDVFLRVIAPAESDSHRAVSALTRQQRGFIEKRNASSAAAATIPAGDGGPAGKSSIRSPSSRL